MLQLSGIGQWGTNNSTGAGTATRSDLSNNWQTSQAWDGQDYGASPQATEVQWESDSANQPIQQQSPLLQPQWDAPVPQLGIDQATSSPLNASWPQMSPATSNQSMSVWADNGAERQATSHALLPVVYQEPQANDMRQATIALQLIPENVIEHLLPEVSAMPETVYVRPLYTNPRSLIPKYRIISGVLSVLIITLLLCGGAGYYAQASGIIGKVVRMFTGAPPSTVMTPLPPNSGNQLDKIDSGPALSIIPSGTTTLHIDKNNIALETDKVFTVNQTFYVTYIVQPPEKQDGKVSVKWYMDGLLYRTVISDVIKGGITINGSVQMQYAQPTAGSVEVDWNDQLGQRFYFVVQPAK